MSDTEDKGYTIKDRRFHQVSEEEAGKAEAAEEKAAVEEEAVQEEKWDDKLGPDEVPLPEITFSSFLFSLSTSAFVHLGAVPDPSSGKPDRNLSLAKQTIDLLGLLREKTRNNLTKEEEDLFDHLLYDLRMRYIKEAG